ncbi:MAG TPA: Fe-S oxidoreductase [Microscillaceae bacterium]|nr:Fe-S oxidoreductase [Microscillaceae bacterium]
MVVDIFIPCFIDQIYPQTGMNMVKILKRLGCEVNYNPGQTCCGQPAYNAGYFKQARAVAQKFLKDFDDPHRHIVCPSASCVGMVRNGYEHLLETQAEKEAYFQISQRTFELSEFIVDVLNVNRIEGSMFQAVATYHDSCSALRECGIKQAPRTLLSNVKGLQLVEMKDAETCCGFGGTFAVKFQAISVGMAEQKIDNAVVTEASYIISTDSSCLMHLDGYLKKNRKLVKTIHLADVLANGW